MVDSQAVKATSEEHREHRLYALKTFIAGGVAGCAGKTVVAPLDRVKILFQANQPQFQKYAGSMTGVVRAGREIVATQGVSGLYRGHSMSLLRIFPYAAIKFMAYEQIRLILMPTASHETDIRTALAGSLAGVSSVIVTYPLELIRVRMAYDTTQGVRNKVLKTLRAIYGESGYKSTLFRHPIRNFYSGFGFTIMGMMPYAGVSFYTYESLYQACVKRFPELTVIKRPQDLANAGASSNSKKKRKRGPRLNWWSELLIGGTAGIIGQTISYPFEVTRRWIQVAGVRNPGSKPKPMQIIGEIMATKGIRGFYVGLSIGYIKVAPMSAVAFYVYERMKYLLKVE
ncbi:coenzyme A transporter [Dimargaris cristalligena]|uniref:Mitochondrial carrier domain-containing protein n=1 Tax=Dimargaris cristalligena TaxID=215637 RepID=A0A4Q0A169_9FUNG|nr:coenzyme A transporter [Dimargaris cristalligena]RKP39805.1 mitochondrial carrier domain-containing protein [Dimargaris cristalligena]|eukprot:RKP39805.1 mitochondrial carrier domain-containing protein [Dimargaris cristalligena]